MPWARGPQAAVWASRRASARLPAEAVPLPRLPLNSTVAVHSTFWDARVDQSRKAPKAKTRRMPTRVPRLAAPRGTPLRVSLFFSRASGIVVARYLRMDEWNVKVCFPGSGNIWISS